MTFYKFPFVSEQWFRGDDLDSFLKRYFGTKIADRLRTETARTEYSMYGPIDVVHIFKLSPGGQYRDPFGTVWIIDDETMNRADSDEPLYQGDPYTNIGEGPE